MGLQLRHESSRKVRAILTLIVISAFVVQPIYSLKNASFASAESSPVTDTVTVTPATPLLASPANNAKVRGTSVTQSWANGGVLEVDHYVYESYHDAALSNLRWRGNIQGVSKTANNVPEATFWWRVKAVDSAGNSSPWSEVWKLTIDNTKPTASLAFPSIGNTAKSFKVKFNETVKKTEAENPANYFLHNWPGAPSFDDLTSHATVSYDEATSTATVTFTNPDWYVSAEQKWGVRYTHDIAGNEIDSTTGYSTPLGDPVMTSTTLNENNNHVTWNWTADDFVTTNNEGAFGASGIKEYAYQLVKDSTVILDWTTTTNSHFSKLLSDGSYTFSVKAWDRAGNQGNTLSVSFGLDSTAPTLTMDTPVLNEDGSYTTRVTTDDPNSPVSFYLDGVLLAGATSNDDKTVWTVTTDPLDAETAHTIRAESSDKSGNAAPIVSKQFTVPPVTTTLLGVNIVPSEITQPTTSFATVFTQPLIQQAQPEDNDTGVLGTETKNAGTDIVPVSATPDGWKIFGIAWYWILLATVVIGSIAWWIVAAARRRVAQDI